MTDKKDIKDYQKDIRATLLDIEKQLTTSGVVPSKTDNPDAYNANPFVAASAQLNEEVDDLVKLHKPDDKKSLDYLKCAEATYDVVKTTYSSVKVFTNPDSNGYDIAAGALAITSSILKGLMVLPIPIPGSKLITAGLWFATKVAGSILGLFGHKEAKTDYRAIMEEMLNEATSSQTSKELWQTLNGALNEMRTYHYDLTFVLSRTHTEADLVQLRQYAISPYAFDQMGMNALGQAYVNLEDNLRKENNANWKNTADTFFRVSEVAGFKVLLMLEAMAYYDVLQGNGKDVSHVNSEIVANSLKKFMEGFVRKSEKYLVKPTITTSVITHHLYRMPKPKFMYMAEVYEYMTNSLGLPRAQETFFHSGSSQYRFNCASGDSHATKGKQECVRLGTVEGRHMAANHQRSLSVSSPGKERGGLWMPQNDYYFANDDRYRTHFALWAHLDDEEWDCPPYYSWSLQVKTSDPYKQFNEDHNLYIFFVYPTQEEATMNMWGKDWDNNSVKGIVPGKEYLMMGSRGGDKEQVWSTWGDYFRKIPTYNAYYSTDQLEKRGYGNPYHSLWSMLSEQD